MTVMLAKAEQGLFAAQAFQQGQAENLAGTLIFTSGIVQRTVFKRLRLVSIVLFNES